MICPICAGNAARVGKHRTYCPECGLDLLHEDWNRFSQAVRLLAAVEHIDSIRRGAGQSLADTLIALGETE